MTETTETIETLRLPNGNAAFKYPDGDVADPAFVTLKNLVAMGQERYDAAVAWVSSERQRAAERLAEREAELEITMSDIRKQVEARHAAFAADLEAKPWRRDL